MISLFFVFSLLAAAPDFHCGDSEVALQMNSERGTLSHGTKQCAVRVIKSERVERGHMPGVTLHLAAPRCSFAVNPVILSIKKAGPKHHARLLWSREHPVKKCKIQRLRTTPWFGLFTG